MRPLCKTCGEIVKQKASAINRALREGLPLYCNRACAGLARRREVPLSDEERKERKRLYDAKRREERRDELNAKKLAHYYANHERMKAEHAAYRAQNMHRHVEYCRSPEYKTWKAEYDRQRTDAEFGEFAEAYRLLLDVERELRRQATSYDRRVAKGYYTRNAQKRRRELWQAMQRAT